MLRNLIIVVLALCGNLILAQSDSVMVTELNMFKDGLYITHEDFRNNNPVQKENIISKLDKEQIDFYYKTTGFDRIDYMVGGNTYTVETKKVWGLVQNKTLYLNYNGAFFRVPVFGAICYFAGIVEVTGYYNGIYDPMFGTGMGRAVKTKELNEFMLSYYNGKVINFDVDYLDVLLQNDEEIYKQFKSISKRKRRKEATRFVRMYNLKHPVYYFK